MELTHINDNQDSAGFRPRLESNHREVFWLKSNQKDLQVQIVAVFAFCGWILCGYGYYSTSWFVNCIYLSSVLPFLFDIIFTFTHADMFHFQFSSINFLIVMLLLTYNSLLLLPMFWEKLSISLTIAQYIGSLVININCSLTMLRIYARCQTYLVYFNVALLPIDEVQTGVANRITSDNDLTYSIANIKDNYDTIQRTIYYLRNRVLLTGPFYVLNLLAAIKTNHYAGFINIVTNFIPVSTPFLFLSLIVVNHNGQILRWENHYLIESGCAVTVLGIKLRHAWILSFGSFLFVSFMKLFVLKN